MAFTLAACAEMIFQELPFAKRVERIAELGFEVEIWDWSNKNIDELVATGATFSSMTGYLRGSLTDPRGIEELLETAEQSIPVAKKLNCPRLNLHGTGLGEGGLPVVPQHEVTGEMWLTAENTLRRVAALGEKHGVQFILENLNLPVDHPGVPFALGADTLALVKAVDNPHLRLNLDLYHLQIGEGNLIAHLERSLPYIGEIQIADVPGRMQPGTGEINYPGIARALDRLGYTGTISMEAFASGDSTQALADFRTAFTI